MAGDYSNLLGTMSWWDCLHQRALDWGLSLTSFIHPTQAPYPFHCPTLDSAELHRIDFDLSLHVQTCT